ncbi:hypothetical protein NUF55_003855 [Yersinia enterocolitica]|nr:hypothetical protein [Yersinia enterocolitica]
MNNFEELKKAALGANLHGWTGFEDALNDDGYSEAVSKFIGHCRPSEILALIAQLEAAQKERDEFRLAFQQNEQAKQELFAQKDLLITANLNISRRAEKAEAELSAANEKHGWIKRSDQMPDPNQQRRVCVFTPSSAADLRYRLVPANLFKAVCSSSTHWHYVNDPVEGNADAE